MTRLSITLRKADGDLFLDPETGRPDTVSGWAKVDQELADMYLSDFDSYRNWGSSLRLENITENYQLEQLRSLLFLRLQQANDRMLAKQDLDPSLTSDEKISQFSLIDVLLDIPRQALIFVSVADIENGDVVEKVVGQDFKATSLKHVISPVSLV